MKIKYSGKKLEKRCTDFKEAKKEYSQNMALKLHSTINFILSAANLSDIANVPSYRLHPLMGNRKGTYAIDLGKTSGFRLIIQPLDDEENIIKDHSDIQLIYKCTKIIIILEVSNHYE